MPGARKNQLGRWLKKMQAYWAGLTLAAAWLLSTFGSFLLPPPIGISSEDEKVWLRLAQFVLIILLGLGFTFIAARNWNEKNYGRRWRIIYAFFTLLAILSFFGYQYLKYSWTCRYNNQTIVIGTSYTPQGRSYLQSNSAMSCENLLEDFA